MKNLILTGVTIFLIACSENKTANSTSVTDTTAVSSFNIAGKKVIVYKQLTVAITG